MASRAKHSTPPDIASASVSQSTMLRDIHYGYDPVGVPRDETSQGLRHFPFMEVQDTADSVYFDPKLRGVPWPTTFPGCRQTRHWAAVDHSVRTYMDEIQATMPQRKWNMANGKNTAWAAKRQELIETSVLCSIYLFTEGNQRRAELTGRLLLLSFLHDDVIEFHQEEKATVVDDLMVAWPPSITGTAITSLSKSPAFVSLATEFLEEDKILGAEALRGLFIWVQHTHGRVSAQSGNPPSRRSTQLTDMCMFTAGLIKFGYGANVRVEDMYLISNFTRLWLYHLLLVNDLYSFDKELRDAETMGCVLVNAVDVIRRSLGLSDSGAKQAARVMLLDLEGLLAEECDSFRRLGVLNTEQKKLVRGLLECASGNIFYSTVQGRYGGPSAALPMVKK
ncbi:isoprenoid synthase domain-containing protein [Aspergillus californicus]